MTKEERREIYWQAYFVSLEGCALYEYGINGLCWIIRVLTDNTDIYFKFQESYPELWAQRPKDEPFRVYWFDWDEAGWRKRRTALLKAIELTYK